MISILGVSSIALKVAKLYVRKLNALGSKPIYGKHSDQKSRFATPAHHQVCKAIVVDGGDVAPDDNGVDPLLVEVDGREALEASVVIPEEAVYP